MGEVIVTDVNTEDVDILWPKVQGYLQGAVDRNQGEFTLDDVHADLLAESKRLWIAYNTEGELLASAVCEIQQHPQKKICVIVLLGGYDMSVWAHTISAIESWAIQNGADSIRALTRKGMAKFMKPYNYEEAYTVITRDLSERRIH